MTEGQGRIVLRVQSAKGEARPNAFDALILSTDPAVRAKLSPARLIGMAIPFERELPDGEVTIIVRATEASSSLVSECDVFGPNGQRRVYGRSGNNLAVFVCSRSGILVTGLPEPGSELEAPAA